MRANSEPPTPDEASIWHEVECSSYTADLPLWRKLAEECAGDVLELGCGTGRVALDLAARGHSVTALDSDETLVGTLIARAGAERIAIEAVVADGRSFSLRRRFALVIAPMQVVQLLGGREGRRALLDRARAHLDRGGLLALALADPLEGVPPGEVVPPLPDVRERNGWVFSSIPVAVRREPQAVAIERVRERVSPDGALSRSEVTIRLDRLDAAQLEEEASVAGYRSHSVRRVAATEAYVGSTVVVLEARG